MKKLIFAAAIAVLGVSSANAQLSQGTWMVGGSVADMNFTNGFRASLTPQLGYFIKDRIAVGGRVGLKIQNVNGVSGTQTDWTAGVFSRYYFGANEVDNLLDNGRFFVQGDAGFGGKNSNQGSTTNGVDLGIGAGYAYFITPTVGLEGLLRVGGKVGGGNTTTQTDVNLNIGFQIYLPSRTAKKAINDNQ